jgi:YkoY family integral membrane protein
VIHNILIILNLVVLESLLSIDNAAVLAVMVKDLPGNDSNKALKYGMIGAYVFRGLCLLLAAWLVGIWWLAGLGGLYLMYLSYGHFTKANDTIEEASDTKDSKIFQWASKIGLNKFWATVVLVEIMDLAFSIDNVFAAVALSSNIWIICAGVFIGIAAMRFVSGVFLKLMRKYPTLENSAFVVIALLGIKLVLGSVAKGISWTWMINIFDHHATDLIFSSLMMLIFFIPLLKHKKKGFSQEDAHALIEELEDLSRIPRQLRNPQQEQRMLTIEYLLEHQCNVKPKLVG